MDRIRDTSMNSFYRGELRYLILVYATTTREFYIASFRIEVRVPLYSGTIFGAIYDYEGNKSNILRTSYHLTENVTFKRAFFTFEVSKFRFGLTVR